MTEESPVIPGWAEKRLDRAFAQLPPETGEARDAYARCLAAQKAPSAPSDLLGAEFVECRRALRRALLAAGLEHGELDQLEQELESVEADLAAES